jgi:hypothetical protein
MINDKYTKDADAFELQVSAGGGGEFVTAMIEWQDSLFVLTKQTVVRFAAVAGQAFGQSSANQQYVSNTGALNPWSVVKTDNFAIYLSDRGIYDLTAGDNEQYVTNELSIKVRDRFNILTSVRYHELPWMAYDPASKKLYVALPESPDDLTTRKFLVWNAQMNAWSEYTTPGGFNTHHGVAHDDRTLGKRMTVALTARWSASNAPLNFGIIAFDDPQFFGDFRHNPVDTNTLFFESAYVTHTTTLARAYPVTYEETGQRTAFSLLPYRNVEEVTVLYNNTYLPFTYNRESTTDAFFKNDLGQIQLTFTPTPGLPLQIELRTFPTVYAV